MTFRGHRCVSTVCSPSRFNFLTGRYASRKAHLGPNDHPYFMFGTNVAPGDRSIFTALNRAGYFTGVIGKADGFDWWAPPGKDEVSLAAQEDALHERIRTSTQADYVEGIFPGNPSAWTLEFRYHNQDWLTAAALDFIDQAHSSNQPFFLWMASTIIHTGDRIDRANFADEDVKRSTPFGPLQRTPAAQASRASIPERIQKAGVDPESFAITWLDDSLAAVVRRLEERGLLADTIIVYASDHSGFGGKGTLYDVGARVPLIISWKGHTERLPDNDQVVGSVDLVPTLLDLAGVSSDDYPADGRSLAAAIRTGEPLPEAPLYLEQGHTRAIISGDGRYKYIAFRLPQDRGKSLPAGYRQTLIHTNDLRVPDRPELGSEADEEFESMIVDSRRAHPAYYEADQLYDLSTDPGEQRNLAGQPESAAILAAMRTQLTESLETLPAKFGDFH